MTLYSLLTGLASALLAAAGLLLLLARTERGLRLRAGLERALERLTGTPDLRGLRWWHVTVVAAVGVGAVMGYDLASGLYACPGPGAPSDLVGFLAQGQALWSGANPFTVPDCGTTIAEPDGLAAVAINGLGSLGGLAGVAALWGAVAVVLVPLTWWAAGPDRRYLTLVVASSPLYFPLVSTQIDGASNALVPATVLLVLVLASRRGALAAGIAGFLATQRFPTLFPVLGMTGSFRRRFGAVAALLGVFAAGTAASYLLWGSEFLGPVFLNQFARRSFSLNFWGVLLAHDWLPSGPGFPLAQALLTLVLVGVVFLTVRSPLRAAAIVVTGVALLTQFLSFNILVWLLPVALVGVRPRWWLWGIAVVGWVNYDYGLSVLAWTQAVVWPSELLEVVLTVLLLGLFLDLWRSEDGHLPGRHDPRPPSPVASTRIILPPEVLREDDASSPPPSRVDPSGTAPRPGLLSGSERNPARAAPFDDVRRRASPCRRSLPHRAAGPHRNSPSFLPR